MHNTKTIDDLIRQKARADLKASLEKIRDELPWFDYGAKVPGLSLGEDKGPAYLREAIIEVFDAIFKETAPRFEQAAIEQFLHQHAAIVDQIGFLANETES